MHRLDIVSFFSPLSSTARDSRAVLFTSTFWLFLVQPCALLFLLYFLGFTSPIVIGLESTAAVGNPWLASQMWLSSRLLASRQTLKDIPSKPCKTANTSRTAFQSYCWCGIIARRSTGHVSVESDDFVVLRDSNVQLVGFHAGVISRRAQFVKALIHFGGFSPLPTIFPY